MRGWYASRFGFPDRAGAPTRPVEWTCVHDQALRVVHCGHPTALRPYYIVRGGVPLLDALGTFPWLAMAQYAALTGQRVIPARR